MSEGQLSLPAGAEIFAPLLKLVEDPEIRVRYQLAFTLGEWRDSRAGPALVQLALRDLKNAALQTAVLSSATNHCREMLMAILTQKTTEVPAELLEKLLGLATALGDDTAIASVLGQIAQPKEGTYLAWQFAAMAGLLDALDRQKTSLKKFQDAHQRDLKNLKLSDIFTAARLRSADAKASETERLQAIRLLGRGLSDVPADIERLGELLHPEVPSDLQEAALRRLQSASGANVGEVILAGWKGYGPSLRTEVLNLLFSRPEWLQTLVSAIESEKISTAGIGTVHQQKLLTSSDSAIRQRAVKLFSATRHDRQSVVRDYRTVEKLTGDPAKGSMLFRQNCSTCHRFKGEGFEIGVDLNTLTGKPVEVLLVAILDPNQAVEARYVNYTASTKNGREISGVITAETPTSISIRSPGGNEEVILRSDLSALTSSGLSLMPEGFEKALNPQDLADLISYIRQ